MVDVSLGPPLASGAAASRHRYVPLDVCRGLVLCFILVNHVPGTMFEVLTPKTFGFSDSAEAFVFLSGLSLAFAYEPRFAGGQAGAAIRSLRRRVLLLYGAHVLMTCAAIAIYAAGADIGDDASLMDAHGRDLFVADPWSALLGLLSLGHQLGYFNILPLYIVLIAFLVAQLALAQVGVGAMLVASGLVYGLARAFGWNIPTWPMRGSWFFDPLTWQFMMALGVACAILYRRGSLPRRLLPTLAASGVLVASALGTSDGIAMLPRVQDWAHAWLDLDKTSLGLGRIAHFLALAYVVYGFDLAQRVGATRAGRGLALLGRHGLAMFAALSLLAAAGQVVTALCGHAIPVDCLVVGSGLATLIALARGLDGRDARTRPNDRRLSPRLR